MKYYNTLIPVGEYFKVVIPVKPEPERSNFNTRGHYNIMHKEWRNHLEPLPQAALTKSNKQGWMENVEEKSAAFSVYTGFVCFDDDRECMSSLDWAYHQMITVLVEETKTVNE